MMPNVAPSPPEERENLRGDEAVILGRIGRLIETSHRILVVSHARPDGDAVGSVLAMGEMLFHLGKNVDMVLADEVPEVYKSLPEWRRIRQARTADPLNYDLAVVLECDRPARTGVSGFQSVPILNIDHHATGREYGTINWIDVDAPAVAAMVYRLVVAMKIQVTPTMATCLYAALLTDTGSFTYAGTTAETFAMARELVLAGAEPETIARDVLYTVPAARMHLLGAALGRLRTEEGIAWTYITQDDLREYGATDDDSEGIANALVSLAGVEGAVLLREQPGVPAQFRLSLRAKGALDVSAVAAMCGGGGHKNAAGCTLDGPLGAAVSRVVLELQRELHSPANGGAR